jgi:DNA polymerase-1
MYDGGIPSFICDDGRVRTHIYPTKATGRWSSSRPSLQNISKKAESKLVKIMGDDYRYSLGSLFRPAEGCVFIEADYIGAEIAAAAFMCNDKNLLDHVARNQLPEIDPNYYDIHSHIAVAAFRLECDATKSGLKSIGKEDYRTVAKSILFGLFYGRSPRAIADECRTLGIDVSDDEAERLIKQIGVMYPKLLPYFEACEQRAAKPGWLVNAFGRYRRFPETGDQQTLKRFGRQAKNAPIQGTVADAVNRAVDYLFVFRNRWELKTKLALQKHDAILLEVPYNEIEIVRDKLLPLVMVEKVPIYPVNLDGKINKKQPPRFLGIDVAVMSDAGTKMSSEAVKELIASIVI